jgi:hypothetical protein
VHVAKTAGTSLRRMLELEVGPRLVYPSSTYLARLPGGLYPLASELLENYAKVPTHVVLIGHFTAATIDLLPRPYRAVTFLRDPVQRSLSMLAHFSKVEGISVPDLIADRAFMAANISDYQTRILGADGVCDPHQVESIDDNTLARALRRLETLDFVGLSERFEDSCILFDEIFKTGVSRFVCRENTLRPMGNELSEHAAGLERFVRRDRVLYEMAMTNFETAWTHRQRRLSRQH